MIADWVAQELDTIDLGDARLNDRMKRVLTSLGNAPASSIPAAVGGGRAETEATYRLFENERFGFDDILEPHQESTLQRIGREAVCVIAQDTTENDYTRPHQQVAGAGPLDGKNRRGCLLHLLQAFTEQGIPLGTVAAEVWARDEKVDPPEPPTKSQSRQKLRTTPLEEKESRRWAEGLRKGHEVAVLCPQTRIIVVADSEADTFEVLAAGRRDVSDDETPSADWIIRACQNRSAVKSPTEPVAGDQSDGSGDRAAPYVFDQVASTPSLATYEVTVRGREPKVNCEDRARRQPRVSRTATVEVRACAVTVNCPKHLRSKFSKTRLHAVLVREVNPPAGDVPIEWLLLTSLPISTLPDVQRIIELYCLRWQIEIFFRVLKQGCRIEERLFETLPRLQRFLAVALIISWRTLLLSRLGRETPDVDCEIIFDKSEWRSVYQIIRKQPPPTTPPTLGEIMRMVAQLGGYVNRKKEAYPGPETIWKGLLRLRDLADAWDTFGPGRKK